LTIDGFLKHFVSVHCFKFCRGIFFQGYKCQSKFLFSLSELASDGFRSIDKIGYFPHSIHLYTYHHFRNNILVLMIMMVVVVVIIIVIIIIIINYVPLACVAFEVECYVVNC